MISVVWFLCIIFGGASSARESVSEEKTHNNGASSSEKSPPGPFSSTDRDQGKTEGSPSPDDPENKKNTSVSGKDALKPSTHNSRTRPGKIRNTRFEPDEEPLVEDANIKVYQNASAVVLPAKVVVREAFLELLLCARNGKSHESLLMTEEPAKKVNLSLIMAGFSPEDRPAETGPQYLGDPTVPGGDPVVVEVEWKLDNGQWVRYRAESLLRNQQEEMIMRTVGWRFAGSYFIQEESPHRKDQTVFAASRIKTLIAVFHDPSAILDLPVPQGGTDGLYNPRTEVLPPVETNVRLIMRPPNEAEQKEIDQNIEESISAWSDRRDRLEGKQERKQKKKQDK